MPFDKFISTPKLLVASAALATMFGVITVNNEVVAAEPATASATVIFTSPINRFNSKDFVNGVWKSVAAFSVPATTASIAAFKRGTRVRFADGQVRKITQVNKVGDNLSVYVEGALLDGSRVGAPNTVSALGNASVPATGGTASAGSTAPSGHSSAINNFTNTDWLNGVWRKSAGFSIPATAANQAAFKAGASVRLSDGQIRKITRAQVVGNNMSVFLEGTAIDGNVLGHPKTITVVNTSAAPETEPEAITARPAPTPSSDIQAPATGSGSGIRLVGVNLSAAGFGPQVVPGVYGKHYFYPDESYYKKYADNGLHLVRLPFLWERIQPKLNTSLDSTELARLQQSLDLAQKHGVKVILDMHNYYRYYGKLIGSKEVPIESFASVWKQIVQKVVNHPAVLGYGLMNEPYVTNGLWPQAAEAAAKAIRTLDSERWIYVAGDRYSSAFHFPKYNPNLIDSPWMRDPKNNLVYEAHMYLDKDYSGNYANRSETYAPDLGVERVKPFVDWLKANNLRGYIGEHGVPDYAPSAMVAMDNLLTYLRQNCVPMTYWAAGPWWGEYVLSLDTNSNSHRPQLTVLKKHAAATNNCTSIGPLR
ncbi:glycoside hydrolase family 5 protein [Stutzerimonas nitrititolerans]|uniref:glycoside hydrolase family 5 protein n=1 Tax=Stutzerimonas nitrititolerans TaxID=2482751 RepID=UPI0028AD2887|nr:glycoside hydrolase family 5 protein [Stutzerimonas nitrititolerans]